MGCHLRVHGRDLDVDRLLIVTGLADALDCLSIYRRGEPRMPRTQPKGPKSEYSGINIPISDADFHEFDKQIEDAIESLRDERELVLSLQAFEGVEDVVLDFGIGWRDCVAQFDYLPAELIKIAGELGLSLEVSHYPVSSGVDAPD